MIFIDTNALVRLFINDIPSQAKKVVELFESENSVFVSDVVWTELVYVLSSVYGFSKAELLSLFEDLFELNIKYNSYMDLGIKIYKEKNIDIADCIIIAQVLETEGVLASFDKKMSKSRKIKNYF